MALAVCAADLWQRGRAARIAVTALGATLACIALVHDGEAASALRRTGGQAEWSPQIDKVVSTLGSQPEGPLYVLDWGLAQPLRLLSKGVLHPRELYWNSSALQATGGRKWTQLIANGGTFVTYGNHWLHYPQATISFRAALQCAQTPFRTIIIPDRQGSAFAVIYRLAGSNAVPAVACLKDTPVTFFAEPNPIVVTDGTRLGETTLFVSTTLSRFVEIHVDRPDGTLVARFFSIDATNSGVANPGKWISNGMKFYLQDVSAGKTLDSRNTLATLAVKVRSSGSD
jgi:hypothetical protein